MTRLSSATIATCSSLNRGINGSILAGTAPPAISGGDCTSAGGPDEASEYVAECGPAWGSTPGAVEWLSKITASLPANDAYRRVIR